MFNLYKRMQRGPKKELGRFVGVSGGKGLAAPDGEIRLTFANESGDFHEVSANPLHAELLIYSLAEYIAWCDEFAGKIGVRKREERKAATIKVIERVLQGMQKKD